MALVRVEPTNVDVAIADAISGRTRLGLERAAKASHGAQMSISSAPWRLVGGNVPRGSR